jgi:hypothetical protein
MKTSLLFMLVLLTTFFSSAQAPTDLFFSEYIEGTGNNKAVEIYNPTKQTIDLSSYWVLRFSNGSSTFAEGGATHLTGTLASFKTFVLVNGQTTSTPTSPACSPVLQAKANQLDGAYPAPLYMNGNDAIALVKTLGGVPPAADMSNVTSVDLIGQIGQGAAISAETGWSYVKDTTVTYKNSGGDIITGKVVNYIVQAKSSTVNGVNSNAQFGPFWLSWTSDHTLIRKPAVIKGVVANPNPFKVSMEWDTIHSVLDTAGHWYAKDIWTNLGTHTCIAASAGINDLSADSWLTIYPNPVVADYFTINSNQPIKEIEIFSAIGVSVYKQSGRKDQQEINIKTDKLSNGMYIVKVTSISNTTTVKKILVR